jgi:hypothetical protein
MSLRNNEGAGNAGCALHPRSRVQNGAKNAHEHTGSAEALRHSLRNGLTAYGALSPAIRICLSPSPREYGLVRPVGLAKPPRDLTPTMRRQDHTLLPYAHAPFVLRAGSSLTGQTRPAIPFHADAAASTASHPAFVTIATRPSCRVRRGELVEMICPTAQGEYFCAKGWTGFGVICPAGCFVARGSRDFACARGDAVCTSQFQPEGITGIAMR